jgi:hypothetical protein
MLENLRDYPRDFLNIYFKDNSDGIISGADIKIKDKYIYINEGIIKFKGVIYILNKEKKVEYFTTEEDVLIKIKIFNKQETNDFTVYDSEVFIDQEIELKGNELELGRFKLREGAKLRAEYKDFADYSTEYNVINRINVKYSGIENPTISPVIIKSFAKILISNSQDNLDINFAMQCLNSKIVNRIVITSYLENRLKLNKENYNNEEIYKYLKLIAKKLQGAEDDIKVKRRRTDKIIVD